MRLNGWQRLWVVGTVLWTLTVGIGTWRTWPAVENDVVSVIPTAYGGGTIDYYEALAFVMGGSLVGGASVPPVVDGNEGMLVEVPDVGTVSFPRSMTTPQAEVAAKSLVDEHGKLLQRINRERRGESSAKQLGAIRIAAGMLLLPPLMFYALGAAVAWVYRGFRASA